MAGLTFYTLMLFIGSDPYVSFLLSVSIFIGLLSASSLRGLHTIYGSLVYIFLYKFLLIAIVLKVISFDPVDDRLHLPQLTALVVTLGFLGLYFAAFVFAKFVDLRKPREGILLKYEILKNDYLLLTVVLISFGVLGSLLRHLSTATVEPTYFKLFKVFIPIGALSVFTIIEYFYLKKAKNFLYNLPVLTVFFLNVSLGLVSASKADLLLPVLVYGLTIVKYKGLFYKPLVIGLISTVLIFVFIIYPYSQVVRYLLPKDGSLSERIEVIENVDMETLEHGIKLFTAKYGAATYLPTYLMPFNRFAMIGEAHYLIAATYKKQDFTGFETIIWGLQYAQPSFIPGKKEEGTGNFFGRYTGQLAPNDYKTFVSYGVFANAYNAYDIEGVVVVTFFLYLIFFIYMYIFFGNPKIFSLYWFFLFVSLQHAIVEATIAGFIAAFIRLPISIILLLIIIKIGHLFFQPRSEFRLNT